MPPVADPLPAPSSALGSRGQQLAALAPQPTASALNSLLLRCRPAPADSKQELLAKQHVLLLVKQVYEAYVASAAEPPLRRRQRSSSAAQQHQQLEQQTDQDIVLQDSQPCSSRQQQEHEQQPQDEGCRGVAHGTEPALTLLPPHRAPLHTLLGAAASSSLHEQDITTTTSAQEQPGSTKALAAAAAPHPHNLTYHQALDRLLGPRHNVAAASILPPRQQQQQQQQRQQQRQQQGAPAYLGRQRRLPAAAAAAMPGAYQPRQQQGLVDQPQQGVFDSDSPGGVQQQRRLLQLGAAGLTDAQSQAPGGAAACVQTEAGGGGGGSSGGDGSSGMPPSLMARSAAAAQQQLFSPRTATHEPLTAGGAASGSRPRRRSSTGGTRLQHARSGTVQFVDATAVDAPAAAAAASARQQSVPALPLPESDEIEVTPSQRPCALPRAAVAAAAATTAVHQHQPDNAAAAPAAALTRRPVPQPWGSGLPGTAAAAAAAASMQRQQLGEPPSSSGAVAATPADAAPGLLLRHAAGAADLATALFHTPAGCQQHGTAGTPCVGAGADSGQRRRSTSASIDATPGFEDEGAAPPAAPVSGPVAAGLLLAEGSTPQHSLQPHTRAAASLLPATFDETLPPSQEPCSANAVPPLEQHQQALLAPPLPLAATPPPPHAHAHAVCSSIQQHPMPPGWQQQQQQQSQLSWGVAAGGGGGVPSQIPATPLSVEQQQQQQHIADRLLGGHLPHEWPAAAGGGGSGSGSGSGASGSGARATPAAVGGGARCLLGSFVAGSPVMTGPTAEGVQQHLQRTLPAAGGLLLPPPSPMADKAAAEAAAAPEVHVSNSTEQPRLGSMFGLDRHQHRVQHVQLGLPVAALHCCAGTAVVVLKCPQESSRHVLLHLQMQQKQQHEQASVSLAGAAALHHTATLTGPATTHLLQSAVLLLPPVLVRQQPAAGGSIISAGQEGCAAATARGPLLAVASSFRCQALDNIPSSSSSSGGGGSGTGAPDTAAVGPCLGVRSGSSSKRTLPRMAAASPSAAAAAAQAAVAAGSASHSSGVSIFRLGGAPANGSAKGLVAPAAAAAAGDGPCCEPVQQLPTPRDVQSLAVSWEAGLLAAGCEGGCVCLWQLLAADDAAGPAVASAESMQELPRAYYRTLMFDEIAHLCFVAQPLGSGGSSSPAAQHQHMHHQDNSPPSTAGRVLLVGCCKLGSTAVWDALAGTLLYTVHTPGLQLSGLSVLPQLPDAAFAAMLHDAQQASVAGAACCPQQQQQQAHKPPAVPLLARVLDRSCTCDQGAQQSQQHEELRPVLVQSSGVQCGVPLVADATASRLAGCVPAGAVTAAALCGSSAVAATAGGTAAHVWDVVTGRVCMSVRQGAAGSASGGVQAVGLVPLGGGLMVVLLGSNTGRLSLALL